MATSSAIALAAAKPSTYENPFGLNGVGGALSHNYGIGGAQGYGMLNPPQTPAGQTQKSPTGQTPVIPIPTTPATTPGAAAAPTATMNTTFDLQTDPALQQVNALAGLNDQQAQAQALKQQQQLLLQYGDPHLAASVLGQNDPMVQAAAQNPESDLAMLQRERDQNLRQFETQLDPSLVFSGYRVGQEQQLGQAYQDALAKAAAGVQQGLGTIEGDLGSALAQNNANRMNGLSQAEANQMQLILAGLGGGTSAAAAAGGASGGAAAPPPVSGGGNTGQTLLTSPQALANLAEAAIGKNYLTKPGYTAFS